MSKVITFPNALRVDAKTKGTAVIVGPRGRFILAWVRTERGWAILEESWHWAHALAAGRSYAARYRLPFRFQSRPLDSKTCDPLPMRGGEITIEPSERDGGSWDILHVSGTNHAVDIVGNAFAFEKAVLEARRIASERGATFEDDASRGTAK